MASHLQIDMIFRIFRTLGTPSEDTWPNVTALPDFQGSFPTWSPVCLSKKCPTLVSKKAYHHNSPVRYLE